MLVSDCYTQGISVGQSNYWSIMYNNNLIFSSSLKPFLSTIPLTVRSSNTSTIPYIDSSIISIESSIISVDSSIIYIESSIISVDSSIISIDSSTISIESSILSVDSSIISIDSSIISYINSSLIEPSILPTSYCSIISSNIFSKDSAFQSNIFLFNNSKNQFQIFNETVKENEIEQKFNGGKEELLDNLTDILNNITIGLKYKITGDVFILTIKPTNSSFLENSTHVNFINCENTLRKKLNISASRIITFLQLEMKIKMINL